MTKIYSARWVLPVSSTQIEQGAVAVESNRILGVGNRDEVTTRFPEFVVENFGEAAIIPGLINAHSHLELTAMRGFLEDEENDFFAWLKKLTMARLERMTPDDLLVSATWGTCEAARAGVTCLADASDSAAESMKALSQVGLRGIVFQESFGPDLRLARENFEKLRAKISLLRSLETDEVKCGVSPHAPYTVSGLQLELISSWAIEEKLSVMMHAAETAMEVSFLQDGQGPFADGLRARGIEWHAPGLSPIQYLKRHGVLQAQPLLAHCIHVNDEDIATIEDTETRVAHCPKSNTKLGHGIAPLSKFVKLGIAVGFGSDSVASNNTCDLLEEARFAGLMARGQIPEGVATEELSAASLFQTVTSGGARALGLHEQIGELREGLQADFAVVSLDGQHQVPCYEPTSTLIFASSGRDVVLTVVAGREVYREGRVAGIDEDRLRARMSEIAEKLTR